MTFCTDTDLLHWEPDILREAAFASQTLITGTGDLAGTTFTLDSAGSFTAAHVTPMQVIVITGGTPEGCYPIVSVDGATQLTVSVLYDGLFPESGGAGVASPVATSADRAFAIRTFWPQRKVVSDLLLAAAGLDPSNPEVDELIINPDALRKPAALGTLHMIYAALAAASAEPAAPSARADLYERLYRRALRSTVIELDLNGDGEADTTRHLNVLQLQRT